MIKLMNENIEKITIEFDGAEDIDLETLSKFLNNTLNVLKTIAQDSIDPNQYCKFKLTDVRKGSIEIDIVSIVSSGVDFILTNGPSIITIMSSIFSLKKHLNGKEPKEVKKIDDNKVEIYNHDGEVQVTNIDTLIIYASNDNIENGISKSLDILSKDKDRGSMRIKTENKKKTEVIEFSKKELLECSNPIDVSKLISNTEETTSEAVLRLIKPDYYGNSKWMFYLNNQRIEASILDEVFLDKVHHNEYLFNGSTRLKVHLRTKFKVDKSGYPVEHEKPLYNIDLVMDVIQGSEENIKLF